MPEAIPQNDAIDGVSLHWFPKDLNLRKILTSKVQIKRGNWTGSSDRLQRYATVKNAQTIGPGPAPEDGAASGTE